jgi:hypothetical protein
MREHGFPARYLEGGFEGWTGLKSTGSLARG